MKSFILGYLFMQLTGANQLYQKRQSSQSTPNLGGGSCILYGGILHYLGGYVTPKTNTYSNTLYTLNLSGNFNMSSPPWGSKDGIVTARFQYSPSAAVDSDSGKMYIFGGYDIKDSVSTGSTPGNNLLYEYDAEKLRLSTLTDTSKPNDPEWRSHHTLNYLPDSNKLVLHGGQISSPQNNQIVASNATYLFDIGSKSWSLISNGGPAVYHHYSIVYKNKLYVLGGMDSNNIILGLNKVNVFDFNSKTWASETTSGSPPLPAIGMGVSQYGSTLAFFGGNLDTNNSFSNGLPGTLNLENLSWGQIKSDDIQSYQRSFMCTVTTPNNNIFITQGERLNSDSQSQLWDTSTWLLISNNMPIKSSSGGTLNETSSKIFIIAMAVCLPLLFIFMTWLTCYCYKRREVKKSAAYTVDDPVWTGQYDKSSSVSVSQRDNYAITMPHDMEDPTSFDTDLFTNPDTVMYVTASQSHLYIPSSSNRTSHHDSP